MNIFGQEFSFSALNANDIERMERAQKHLEQAAAEENKRTHTGYADQLRGQCRLMMGYLDELLGEGASERLGLDGSDFGECARAANAIKEAIMAEQAEMQQTIAVPQNRAQRRAEKRKRKPPVSYPAQPAAAQMVERVDKAARRKELLRQLAELDND